jgi:two-component system chemotaxis response regulator CheB
MARLVVVGTSLGGFTALGTLLRALPRNFPAPIAIVQHRGKAEDDALERLLAAQTSLRVYEPNDKDPLEIGRIYLAPADYHLLIEPESVALSTAPPRNFARPSIDVLFESAADAHGSGVIAVVLTGSNHDGAAGARYIKERGGTILVEDPATAHSGIMPAGAIAATAVDAVLPLQAVSARLTAMCASKD